MLKVSENYNQSDAMITSANVENLSNVCVDRVDSDSDHQPWLVKVRMTQSMMILVEQRTRHKKEFSM